VLEPAEPLGGGLLGLKGTGGSASSSHGALLKKGAPLFWPDGSPAGTARADVVLARDPDSFRGASAGARDCGPVDLVDGVPVVPDPRTGAPPAPLVPGRTLVFCFDRASVETWGSSGM
jgi:hypothetical protein